MATVGGGTAGDPGLVLIERQTLSGASASVTFTGIPATYQALRIEIIGRTTYSAGNSRWVFMSANNDVTTANYRWSVSWGGVYNGNDDSSTYQTLTVPSAAGSSPASDSWGQILITLGNYADAQNKVATCTSGEYDSNGSYVLQASWNWAATAAITELDFTLTAGENFAGGSIFSMYGVA